MTAPRPALEHRDALTAAAVGIGALLLLAAPATLGVPQSSVGPPGALRILDGQFPYVDFWTLYAPGHFFLLAGLFALLGAEVAVAMYAAVAFIAASTAVVFVILRRLGLRRASAIAVASLFAALFWRGGPLLSNYQPAVFLLLLGWDRLLVFFQRSSSGPLIAAAALFGCAAWFKHDIGAYSVIAGALALLLHRPPTQHRHPTALARAGLFAGIAGLTVLPVALWVAARAGGDAYDCLLRFAATDFPASRPERYPGFLPPGDLGGSITARGRAYTEWLVHNLPAWVFATLLAFLLVHRRHLASDQRSTLVFFLALLPLHWIAAHVQINTHIYTMGALCLFLLALLYQNLRPSRGRLLLWVPALALLHFPVSAAGKIARLGPYSESLQYQGTRGLRVSAKQAATFAPLIRFVRKNTAEDERIYVGVHRHDAVVVSHFMLYPILGRLGCSRYDELHPAIADRQSAQAEIIASLKEHQVRCIVLWKIGWPDARLDQIKERRAEALPGTGATLLDEYLADHYQQIGKFGEYRLLWTKAQPAPAPPLPEKR
jgi:hypothetical protein